MQLTLPFTPKKTMKRKLVLPNIYWYNARKIYTPKLELEIDRKVGEFKTIDLETITEYDELSICGEICYRHSVMSCGQNIDEIARESNLMQVNDIARIWKRWHLNGMKTGTRDQQKQLDADEQGWRMEHMGPYEDGVRPWTDPEVHYEYKGDHYRWACDVLKACGIYEDRGYVYGSAWLVEPLPSNVKDDIMALFGCVGAEQQVA